ncbi:hypothetical protein [Sorangium sp. So ce1000]|uniref:hypothetical protein n=1 Tax=Sorangium sp. So ce1000 TaxID=3133325 RepID=UPI003F6323D2
MRRLYWVVIVCIAVGCVFVDWQLLSEAYGQAPPYYGRTENMDKWTSPIPALLLINGGALAVMFLLGFQAVKR